MGTWLLKHRTRGLSQLWGGYSSAFFIILKFKNVQEHFSEWVLVNTLQYWQQTSTDLGQKGPKWSHQAYHRQRHPVSGVGNCRHKCQHNIHHLPSWPSEDAGNKTAIFSYDHQKLEKVLHIWSYGFRWQECEATFPCKQLPEHDKSKAFHLHYAHETGWRMEPDSVQLVWLHQESVRHKLHWDTPSADPCKLQDPQGLLLGQIIFWRWIASRIQTLPTCATKESMKLLNVYEKNSLSFVHIKVHSESDQWEKDYLMIIIMPSNYSSMF